MAWSPGLRHAPLMIVVALVLGRTLTLALAAFHRANAFLSLWPIDLANINQAIWNTAHGKPYFNTIFYEAMRGHFDPILMLVSPVYLVTDSLLGVFLVYSLIISSGAIAVYLLARTVVESETISVLVALAYLCFTPLVELTVLQIRGEVFAVPFLLFAFFFYRERRFVGFAVFAILALMCKETIAVVMILWGCLALIQRRELKWILAPIIAGAGVLVFTLFIYHPHIQGFPYKHTSLAKRQTEIGPALILNPDSWRFLLERFFNWGGVVSLASPVPLLLATPFLAASFVWPTVVHHPMWFHTFAPAYAFLFASFTLAVAGIDRRFTSHRGVRQLLAALLVAGSVAMTYDGRNLYRFPNLSSEDNDIHALIDQIPAGASVAAPPLVLPPLSTRPVLRSLIIKDARGTHIDPLDVDWILVHRGTLPWSRLITMPKGKVFEVDYQAVLDRMDAQNGFDLVEQRGRWELHRRKRVPPSGGTKEQPPSVVVITVDTLRADHVGAYGGSATTPAMDELARQGTVFDNAAAPMPMTIPAHTTIFTSTDPRDHGVLNNRGHLGADDVTLAETLKANGYRTAGFYSASLLGGSSGLDRGFDVYSGPDGTQEPGGRTIDRAVAWLNDHPEGEPFFLWVHLFDPHEPYSPPAPYDSHSRADLPAIDWRSIERLASENEGHISKGVLDHARGLYRGEVEYTDACVDRLLTRIAAMKKTRRLMTILTADHGECFEHGIFFEHAHCMWQAGIQVPLIIRYSPTFQAGSRRTEQVGLIDIAPTILSATGIAQPKAFSGFDLSGPLTEDRMVLVQYPVFSSSGTIKRAQHNRRVLTVAGEPVAPILFNIDLPGLVGPMWKIMRGVDGEHLYSIAPRCSEPSAVNADHPGIVARLSGRLAGAVGDRPLDTVTSIQLDPATEEALRALGYLQ